MGTYLIGTIALAKVDSNKTLENYVIYELYITLVNLKISVNKRQYNVR